MPQSTLSSHPRTHHLSVRLLVVFALAAASILTIAIASISHAVTSISQSYATTDRLPMGALVSLEKDSSDRVVAAANSNVDSLLGVVVNIDSSLLAVTNDSDNQAQVATSGTLQVLVSNINGDVKRGDYITASPVSGIGMKATGNVKVIGIAQSDLSTKNGGEQKYNDKDGKEQTILVGQVPLLVNVSFYYKEADKTLIPSAIQNVANALAGRSVSPVPILISAGIFLVTVIVVVSIIYSMIRSSIISVGRNPMSQSAVYRDLIQLSALVLGIIAVGFTAIYLVLTKL